MSRILYTVTQAKAHSKKTATDWVKKTYSEWKNLIDAAQEWQYDQKMEKQEQTRAFLTFVIKQVRQSPLYKELQSAD